MGARRKGRIIAFQSLYRYDLSGASLEELFDFSWLESERAARRRRRRSSLPGS